MSRKLINLIIVITFLTFSFLIFLSITNYGPEIEKLQNTYIWLKVLLASLGVVTTLGIFYLWGIMFYHWGHKTFSTKKEKTKWFLVMILLQWIGAIIYYFTIVRKEFVSQKMRGQTSKLENRK